MPILLHYSNILVYFVHLGIYIFLTHMDFLPYCVILLLAFLWLISYLVKMLLHLFLIYILHYMYTHLGEKLTLAQLSRQFFLSESAISAYITQTTGLSFFDLLGEMRVGKSISFLLYTDLTMEQLAEILGFVDSSHISKVFSARLGMKASEFREVYRRVGGLCGIQDDPTAYEVVSYLYHNYARDLMPQHTAARFGLSVKELNGLLLYQVEKDFSDFLNFLRINRACTLLKTTEKSVTDIAFEVGYNTVKTFSRNFLRFRRMSPSAFRQEVALQENTL